MEEQEPQTRKVPRRHVRRQQSEYAIQFCSATSRRASWGYSMMSGHKPIRLWLVQAAASGG
jgi:hypothetical protein